MNILLITLSIIFLLWLIARFYLAPKDHSQFDSPIGQTFAEHSDDAAHAEQLLKLLTETRSRALKTRSLKRGLAIIRELADNFSSELDSDCEFKTIITNGVPCEWTVAPNANERRRVLFLHGGAFIFGSPKGHRIFTHKLAHFINGVVLSVDYRLMPEHNRKACVKDAKAAYQYILEHGPNGKCDLAKLAVSGDSAGGNLTAMLSNWARDNSLRTPDAVVGVAPSLDSTLESPTVKRNLSTDKLLGPSIGALAKLPKTLGLWVGLLLMRAQPKGYELSPLLNNLADLPPTLLHASSSEILLGDSIRYTNKAVAAGSDVRLQIWENQLHDFHLFSPDSGAGKEAWHEIEIFLKETLG